jgi:PncC family amidohydrolase
LKRELLGVSEESLEEHGAVSEEVATAMALGARTRFGTSHAVAVTGIAGPTGGTAEKPVGLTYVAVADETGHDVRRFEWHGGRSANKRDSARAALQLLLERLGEDEQAGAVGQAGAATGNRGSR